MHIRHKLPKLLRPPMDPLTNPYAPGAGAPPPELAGRDGILAAADIAIQRRGLCRPARSLMFIGLWGVGKTVNADTSRNTPN